MILLENFASAAVRAKHRSKFEIFGFSVFFMIFDGFRIKTRVIAGPREVLEGNFRIPRRQNFRVKPLQKCFPPKISFY